MNRVLAIAVVPVLISSSAHTPAKSDWRPLTKARSESAGNPLMGVWRSVQTTFFDTAGPRIVSPTEPGLLLFTQGYYSAVAVQSARPRPDLPADVATATANELRAVWGRFAANAGTYVLSGDTLTLRPIVAKNPAIMAPGYFQKAKFRILGDSLWVRVFATSAGPANEPEGKLVRVEASPNR